VVAQDIGERCRRQQEAMQQDTSAKFRIYVKHGLFFLLFGRNEKDAFDSSMTAGYIPQAFRSGNYVSF
jgi:hypothetical protein